MKELLSKTWVKVLLIIAIFFGGLLIMGKCEKASAGNFYIDNGATKTEITYDENQRLVFNHGSDIYLSIIQLNQTYFMINIEDISDYYTYYNCTYSAQNATMTCNNYNYIKSNGPLYIDVVNGIQEVTTFTINMDNVVKSNINGSDTYSINTNEINWIEEYLKAYNMAVEAETKWNNLLNFINEKIEFTDKEILSAFANHFNNSYDEKEEYYMELIETSWQQKVPSEEDIMNVLMELATMFDESLNSLLTSINQKINFTTEEFKSVDLFGMEENSFETPYDKVEYYMNLINQRWDSYLSENGTGGEYTQEQFDEMMTEFYEILDLMESSWDNTLKLINQKIGFTEDEIIHMLNGETEWNLPEEKEEYYHGLINQRWDSYLSENGTGGSGYSEEELNNKYNQGFSDGVNSVDITTDNQAYVNQYITDNNYHTNEDYLNYGNTKYNQGKASVDITTDNQAYANQYITDNNYHTHTEYLNYGTTKYNDGVNSVDITTDNQSYANQYIIDNNYHTHTEYLNYGETKYNQGVNSVDTQSYYNNGITYADNRVNTNSASYTAGVNSVDITTDNQSYTNQYISDNNYHTHTDYINYGETKYRDGHKTGIENASYYIKQAIENNTYNNISIQTWNNGLLVAKIEDYTLTLQTFINNNNYHTNEEYTGLLNEYGNVSNAWNNYLILVNNKINYTTESEILNKVFVSVNDRETYFNNLTNNRFVTYNQELFNNGVSSVDITTDNLNYANQYIIDNNYHSNSEYLNYGTTKYNDGVTNGKAIGYEQANNDGEVLGSFIPNLLGGFGSLFLTIMNIDILGFNLLTLFGILIAILGIIVVIKFLKG